MSDSNTAVPTPTPALGDNVVYIGSNGKQKLAIVVGTPETVESGTSLNELEPGQLHLAVWEFGKSHFVPKGNVPFESAVADNPEFAIDGSARRVWRTIA